MKRINKLTLRRETIRSLDNCDLRGVYGATDFQAPNKDDPQTKPGVLTAVPNDPPPPPPVRKY